MALTYLKDEKGQLKVDEKTGNPLVYDKDVDEKAEKPFALDGIDLYSKVRALNAESTKNKLKAKDFEAKLEAYKDIDPVKAREAIEKLEGLKAGDLTKAEEVEKLKKEITTAYEAKMADIQKAYETKVSDLGNELSQKDQKIYDLAISDRFSRSKYFSGGEKSLSWMTPSMAKSYLGKYFKVEDGKVVGYFEGNKIMSRANPVQLADFEEALDIIIANHPEKDSMLRAIPGGSGAHGNTGDVGKTTISRAVFESMDALAKNAYASKCAKGEASIKD